jgi:uncharacterized delta-60 repeat protein
LVDTAWIRSYNGGHEDFPVAVGTDLWGSVYVSGYSYGEGTDRDYATVKYNPRGDVIWVRRYDGPKNSEDRSVALAVDSEGNVYVTGWSTGIVTDWDCATIKYYSDGDTAWIRRYNGPSSGDDYSWDIAIDQAGYVFVVGSTMADTRDYLIIKYPPDGDIVWARRYSGPEFGSDWALDIAVDDSGCAYLTGDNWGSGFNLMSVKYQPDGEVAWVKTYEGQRCRAIAVDDSEYVYVSGVSGSYYFIAKLDQLGNEVWLKRYSEVIASAVNVAANHLVVDTDGNIYLCGTGHSPITGATCYLILRYNPCGNIEWAREHYAIYSDAYITDVASDSLGNLYITGVYDHKYLTLKYNSDGDLVWSQEYAAPTGWFGYQASLTLDVMGNIYVAGQGNKNYGDYFISKYTQFWYFRGDVNQDENKNIVDVVYLLNYLFKSGPAPVPHLALGDVDGDADIEVADILYLVDYIFKRGPEPCL